MYTTSVGMIIDSNNMVTLQRVHSVMRTTFTRGAQGYAYGRGYYDFAPL